MPFTRLGQACAEARSLEEILIPAIYEPTFSSDYAATGSYSIKCVTYERFGLGFSQVNKARAGCHFLIKEFGPSTFWPLYFSSRNHSGVAHGIHIDSDAEVVELYFDGSMVASRPFVEVGIEEEVWFHCALMFDGENGTLGAWVGGWDRLFTYQDPGIALSDVNAIWSGVRGAAFDPCYTDNLYVDSWENEPVSVRPPKKHFFYKAPTANGEFHDWSPVNVAQNYQAVDEAPQNGDADYNKALSGGLIDTFETNDISIPKSTDEVIWLPRAVIPRSLAKRNSMVQDANLKLATYDGAQFGYGDEEEYIGPGYQYWWHRFEEQPDGSHWNEDDINNMEYGYASGGTFS